MEQAIEQLQRDVLSLTEAAIELKREVDAIKAQRTADEAEAAKGCAAFDRLMSGGDGNGPTAPQNPL